jgi:type II secretory pathway pseudopilin PulG
MSIRTMSPKRHHGELGYTLVEFAVAMSVFLIFMAIVTPLMFTQLRGGLETQERVDLQQSGRTALRTMVRELRQASQLLAAADKPTSKKEVSFSVDWDGNGVVNGCNVSAPEVPETITYYVVDSTDALYSGCRFGQAVPLADHVKDATFTMFGSNLAFDSDGDGVVEETELNPDQSWTNPELALVTRVHISLTMVDNDNDEQVYEAQAFLRNRVVTS